MTTSFTHDTGKLAETYDRLSDSQFEGGKRLVERIGIREGSRVLDVGCGTGRLTRFIADKVGGAGKVVGIDPLPERIAVAREHAPGIPFDVGQAAVVANGHVLALEAAEGTDHLLNRIADLRVAGRVTTPPGVGVLVKAPKPGQDRRFDLPAIGPQTIERVARAGLAGLAVAANSTIVADPALMTSIADREKIFFAGVGESAGA